MPIGSQYANFQSHKQLSPYLQVKGVTQILDAVSGTASKEHVIKSDKLKQMMKEYSKKNHFLQYQKHCKNNQNERPKGKASTATKQSISPDWSIDLTNPSAIPLQNGTAFADKYVREKMTNADNMLAWDLNTRS